MRDEGKCRAKKQRRFDKSLWEQQKTRSHIAPQQKTRVLFSDESKMKSSECLSRQSKVLGRVLYPKQGQPMSIYTTLKLTLYLFPFIFQSLAARFLTLGKNYSSPGTLTKSEEKTWSLGVSQQKIIISIVKPKFNKPIAFKVSHTLLNTWVVNKASGDTSFKSVMWVIEPKHTNI